MILIAIAKRAAEDVFSRYCKELNQNQAVFNHPDFIRLGATQTKLLLGSDYEGRMFIKKWY